MKRIILVGFTILFLWLIIISSCDKDDTDVESSEETIKIGIIFPFTLEGAYESMSSRLNSLILGKEEINNSGGILNKKIEFIIADNQGLNDKNLELAQSLVDTGCVAIIGAATSSRTIDIAQNVTVPNSILLVTPSGSSPEISILDDNDLVYRTIPSDAFQGKVAAEYAVNDLKVSTAGVIFIDNSYGEGLASTFKSHFESLGGIVKNYVSYEDLDSYDNYDFKVKVIDLFDEQPDLIYIISYATDGVGITVSIKANIDLSYNPKLLGCDANHINYFLPPNSPASVVENMYSLSYSSSKDDENYKTFLTNYINRFGEEPISSYASNGYDALYLIAYAVIEAGNTNSPDIADNLVSVSTLGEVINVNEFDLAKSKIENGIDINYNGASGIVDLDENGDITSGSYIVWQIHNSEFIEISNITFP